MSAPCPAWCTTCDTDVDGTRFHRTERRVGDMATVDVASTSDCDEPEPLTLQILVHDEPPLTLEQARQLLVDVGAVLDGLTA